jgi:hypothetical protein
MTITRSTAQVPSPIDLENHRFVCRSPGVATTTAVWRHGCVYRVGVSVMGSSDAGSDNPFDTNFCDNYIEAIAETDEAALESIVKQMKEMSDGLWV